MESMSWKELREQGFNEIAAVAKSGLHVCMFTPYHFRIDHYIDVFTNDRGSDWCWRNIRNGKRGDVHRRQLGDWLARYRREHPNTPEPQIPEFESESDPGAQTLYQKFVALYASDAKPEEVWALISPNLKEGVE